LKKVRNTSSKVPKPAELIPDNEKIVNEAMAVLPKNMRKAEYVENNFYKVLKLVYERGYEIFLAYQNEAKKKYIEINLQSSQVKASEKDLLIFNLGIKFEGSVSQGRRSRAGHALEIYVQKLFELMGIPCEKPTGMGTNQLKRIDLVVPNKKTALKQPDRAKFLSIKKTLRERWAQVVREQEKGQILYLLTLDENISENKVKEIDKERIVLFVPDHVKSRKELKEMDGVRKLSDLPEHLSQYRKN